jgi:signal transduction histidine kinase
VTSAPTPLPSDPVDDGAARLLRHRWPLVLGVWSVPALLAAFETWMFWRMSGRDAPFWRAVVMEGPAWLTYALATPAIFALGRRLPLRRPRLGRTLATHLVCALVAGAAYTGLATYTSQLFAVTPRPMPFVRYWASWFLSALPLTTLTYFGILGAGLALTYFAESKRRETEAARLAAQLAEARLGALRMQLHPHFLFNTLNAVTVLARDGDTRGVARMLTLLGDLLREVLRTDAAHHVPLDEELAFVRRYLEIERVRFADRLTVHEAVDDAARGALVPAFVLQPLVENALRHGLAPRAAGGVVQVGARLVRAAHAQGADADGVELWVRDDGAGLPADWAGADDYGIGLSNTAARLAELHGGHAALSVVRAAGGGTVATVRLPRRDAPAAAAERVPRVPRRDTAPAAAAR